MKDLNGAFPRTPEAVEDAIHEGIRRGRRRELRRARLRRAACVAAAVSYTHLDLYKRQIQGRSRRAAAGHARSCARGAGNGARPVAGRAARIAQAPLDVDKRQLYGAAGRNDDSLEGSLWLR